jgi:hypothetical protein
MATKGPKTFGGMMRKVMTGDGRKKGISLFGETKKKKK